jgi:hypothetical protein
MERDSLIESLRRARPATPDEQPDPVLLNTIVGGGSSRARRRFKARLALAALSVAAAAALIAGIVVVDGTPDLDMRLVAAATSDAMKGTGRARVDFDIFKGRQDRAGGVMRLTFAGEDLEMITDFEADAYSPGFQSRNRTVDGEFYLYDGPIDRRYWIHDVNASGQQGSDIFNVDPRTFLEIVEPGATFETVSTDDEGVRRLRATKVEEVPPLNLGHGPIAIKGQQVKRLELWVGPDDIVRRFDLDLEYTETHENSGGRAKIVNHEDGTFTKEIDPAHPGETVVETVRTSYAVTFSDLGAPITIEAPAGARRVEGKG